MVFLHVNLLENLTWKKNNLTFSNGTEDLRQICLRNKKFIYALTAKRSKLMRAVFNEMRALRYG